MRHLPFLVSLGAIGATLTLSGTTLTVRRAEPLAPAIVATPLDTMAAPAVGDEAPDFTAPLVGADGKATSVHLNALRKSVVVLAFYPKDRTGGCTAEMSKFRDEYATLFGDGVKVLPVSLDDVASHASWSSEMKLPFALVADSGGTIATRYGSLDAGKPYANRTVFVIGKDGKIVWRSMRFGALDENAYKALAAAVAAAKKG
jgi:peroxiredoxin Q/BCP